MMVPAVDDTAQIAEYVVETFEDSKGDLWFGTIDKGVARYDGTALSWLTAEDGLCGGTVISVMEDTMGNMWFGTHTGACMYDGKSFTRVSDIESRVRMDRKGGIWISTSTGVFRYEHGGLVPFQLPIDRAAITSFSIVPGRHWLALEDSKGNLWFATDGAGAFKYDPSAALRKGGSSFSQFTKTDGLCSNTVWSIVEDDDGRIWFACIQASQPAETKDGGLCRYDGEAFTTFPDIVALSGNDIYTIHKERSGKIWIGATHHGAYRFDGSTFTLFNKTDRPDLTRYFGVQSILEDRKGNLWFGFSGGLFRFNGSSFTHVMRGGPWPRAM